ncbi:MAG: hypothetical protein ACHQD6_06025 [Steroidobacterales bacterium]|jgi:hypothetical protein
MLRPGEKSTTANRRVRGLLLGSFCALCLGLPPQSPAGQPQSTTEPAPPEASATLPEEAPARLRIEGVTGLNDYAALTRLLQGVPGVRRANVLVVDTGSVTFEVIVRGGAEGLEQALAGVARLERIAATGGRLLYRYQPQPPG